MSGYNYSKFVSDFGMRTQENQRRIDKLKEENRESEGTEKNVINEHYEVTQLINSLLGLLIVPYEKYKYMEEKDFSKTKEYYKIAKMIINLEKRNKLYSSYSDKYLVTSFIRHLRNSLAHSGNQGLQFTPISENKAISKIIFYDNDLQYGKDHEFCAELSIGDVRKLSQLLSEMYHKLENYKEIDDLPTYKKHYEKYLGLLKSTQKPSWARNFESEIREKEHFLNSRRTLL